MSETVQQSRFETLLHVAEQALRELATVDFTSYSEDESISALRVNERLRRLQEPVDHALITDLEQRGVPARALCRGTGNWLRQVLTIDIHEANARVRAAHAAGSRRSLVGELLPARYPAVAAAQASGDLAAKQARVITTTLDKLPDSVCEDIPAAEQRLVGFARTFEANSLQKLADRERDHLDPGGTLDDVEKRRRDRNLRYTQRPAPPVGCWPRSCSR